ncbi:hypothetical protein QR680_007978 [Steinernema hermaphroditum]|uniref:Uncharacterized protein n=1 Tax=Steinernema hermaphroditum TaxID=289476 RepID=A0AA39IEX1_9BILA|nr:hypothetical protein QR680_007978 [Steinernema hermaphroditum]
MIIETYVNNCLALFMWSAVIQPEFLDTVLCIRVHGLARRLSKHDAHICVCIAVVFVSSTCTSYMHLAAYYLSTLRLPHFAKRIFSLKYIVVYCIICLLDAALLFGLTYEAASLDQFPRQNDVVCYLLPSRRLSKYVAMASSAHFIIISFVSCVILAALVSYLRKNQTPSNKKDLRTVMALKVMCTLIPLTMAIVPFVSILTISVFVPASKSLTVVANISGFIGMMHFAPTMVLQLLGFKPYRNTIAKMICCSTSVEPQGVVRATTMRS